MTLPAALDPELRAAAMRNSLGHYRRRAERAKLLTAEGRLVRMVGLTLEAEGLQVPVGSRCRVVGAAGAEVEAEVVEVQLIQYLAEQA
jgi:flagellum-specific ATP synthase